jgi:hypothetical protein
VFSPSIGSAADPKVTNVLASKSSVVGVLKTFNDLPVAAVTFKVKEVLKFAPL